MKEAPEIKEFIEKYKRVPKAASVGNTTLSSYSIAYLFSKAIHDKFANAECGLASVVVYNADKYKDTINEEVKLADYTVMVKNFLNFCHDHKRVPAYITTQKSRTKVSFELYLYCLAKIIVFYQKNKYLPNYCVFNKSVLKDTATNKETSKKSTNKSTSSKIKTRNCSNPYTSTPHYLSAGCNKLGQCTSYWCGPHSIHQILKKFGITKYSEKQIAAYAGSTTKGTDHLGINTAIAKISKATGVKLKVEWKTFSSLGKTTEERFNALAKIICQPNKAMIGHIGYANSGKSKITPKSKIFGHYENLRVIDVKNKKVQALNSLGIKKSDGSYPGHLQWRTFETQASFFANTPGGQAALCIITKV